MMDPSVPPMIATHEEESGHFFVISGARLSRTPSLSGTLGVVGRGMGSKLFGGAVFKPRTFCLKVRSVTITLRGSYGNTSHPEENCIQGEADPTPRKIVSKKQLIPTQRKFQVEGRQHSPNKSTRLSLVQQKQQHQLAPFQDGCASGKKIH